MELYFAPLACSMATRISLYEAGAEANFRYVDLKLKRTAEGTDFFSINPLGFVPVLSTDAGELLTENPAVLWYVADRHPEAGLGPLNDSERFQLQQWLSFIGSELHKAVFSPLFDAKATDAAKDFALLKAPNRLARLSQHLEGRDYILDHFSVADAYLVTVLNWFQATRLRLAEWPVLQAYYERMQKRPSVARALAEELVMYTEERARHSAA